MMSEPWSTWTWLFLDFHCGVRLPKCQNEFDHGLDCSLVFGIITSKCVSAPSFLVTSRPHILVHVQSLRFASAFHQFQFLSVNLNLAIHFEL